MATYCKNTAFFWSLSKLQETMTFFEDLHHAAVWQRSRISGYICEPNPTRPRSQGICPDLREFYENDGPAMKQELFRLTISTFGGAEGGRETGWKRERCKGFGKREGSYA